MRFSSFQNITETDLTWNPVELQIELFHYFSLFLNSKNVVTEVSEEVW